MQERYSLIRPTNIETLKEQQPHPVRESHIPTMYETKAKLYFSLVW
jgi:hypothetical protein